MAIPKKPPRVSADERARERQLDEFVAAAPDSKPVNPLRERKKVINIPIRPSLLEEIDKECVRTGVSRAAFFAMAASNLLDRNQNNR